MKKTALTRKTPLRQKSPLRAANPKAKKPRKAIPKAKPSVTKAQRLQRELISTRSEGRCEAEVESVIAGVWYRCPSKATVPAHIYQRPRCGKARDLPEVVIHTCASHNVDHLTRNTKGVRAPLRFAQEAWDTILSLTKLGKNQEDRLRIHIGSIGPRPERGFDLY